jgi:hypothetical protein
MFEVEDGGVSNPVRWSKESLKSENIVMVLDEENLAVWLWHGSKRGLVSKRTALRQAQSLKGHGYGIGKSIVGRGLERIYEIDERKIGRDPETDDLNAKFMGLISRTMHDAGGFVVTSSSGGEPLPMEEQFEAAKPIEMEVIQPKIPESAPPVNVPQPVQIPVEMDPPSVPAPVTLDPQPSPSPVVEEPPTVASEYSDDITIPEPTPLPVMADSGSMESVQKGCVIMAILSHFKDIWVSRLDNNTISVEYMEGPIAKFHIEEGKVKFHEGSFSEIDPSIKNAIKVTFDELVNALN